MCFSKNHITHQDALKIKNCRTERKYGRNKEDWSENQSVQLIAYEKWIRITEKIDFTLCFKTCVSKRLIVKVPVLSFWHINMFYACIPFVKNIKPAALNLIKWYILLA